VKHLPTALATALIVLMFWYSAVAFTVFQWRNPKANNMTYYTEFKNVWCFRKMSEYQ